MFHVIDLWRTCLTHLAEFFILDLSASAWSFGDEVLAVLDVIFKTIVVVNAVPGELQFYLTNSGLRCCAEQSGSVRESEVRAKMVRKLSEANQYIRHLQREV